MMGNLKGDQKLVASFVERLRGKGITLSTEEVAGFAEMMREEILHHSPAG